MYKVERVVPNALFDSAIRKRLEVKSLHPRCRARKPAANDKPEVRAAGHLKSGFNRAFAR
jgi:hypothetical protein